MRPILTVALLLATATACETDSGYVPYVPAADFEEAMEIDLELPDSSGVGVGDWVTLHASRRSGPWVLRDSAATDEAPCEKISPVVEEREVAGKVQWRVEPDGHASFSVPGPPDFDRRISFDQPGRYRIWAVSAGCGGSYDSNAVELEIR